MQPGPGRGEIPLEMMKLAAKLTRMAMEIVLLVAVGLSLLLLGCQRSLIYLPREYEADTLRQASEHAVALAYSTGEGSQTAYYFPPTGSSLERVWLVTGGNGALALDWSDFILGYDGRESEGFLVIDYPGYGTSEGKPGPAAIRESMASAVKALAVRLSMSEDDVRSRLAVLGHSIGAACALMAAEDHGCRRAVLVSPFTTMTDMARRVVGVPLCYLVTHRYDNVARLRTLVDLGAKVTVFHGVDDEIIPVEMSRQLAVAFPETVRLIEIPGAGHNDILYLAEDEVQAAMKDEAADLAR